MNRIFNAAKLDFYTSMSMIRIAAILMIVATVIGVVSHGPDYGMILMMIFGVTTCGSIFSVHEKSHSDKLYGILPLKKSEMILGRYLYALIIGVAYIIVAGIMGFVIWQIMGASANMSALTYWATLGIGFAFFCFATGIAYPVYLKFTFAKAYIFTMMPMYIIAVLFLILTRRTNIISDLGRVVTFFSKHVYLAPIFGLLGGLILLAISAFIANLIYKNKEL